MRSTKYQEMGSKLNMTDKRHEFQYDCEDWSVAATLIRITCCLVGSQQLPQGGNSQDGGGERKTGWRRHGRPFFSKRLPRVYTAGRCHGSSAWDASNMQMKDID